MNSYIGVIIYHLSVRSYLDILVSDKTFYFFGVIITKISFVSRFAFRLVLIFFPNV